MNCRTRSPDILKLKTFDGSCKGEQSLQGSSTSSSAPSSPSEPEWRMAFVIINGYRLPSLVLGGEPFVPTKLLYRRSFLHYDSFEQDKIEAELRVRRRLATEEQSMRLASLDQDFSKLTEDTSQLCLVSRTDAERMLGKMRKESSLKSRYNNIPINVDERIPIEHNMFGPVRGWAHPERKGGRSIQCRDCDCWFTPEHFVMHSHYQNKENTGTVHWGFDSSNWRLMLQVEGSKDEMGEGEENETGHSKESPILNKWREFIGDIVVVPKRNTEKRKNKENKKQTQLAALTAKRNRLAPKPPISYFPYPPIVDRQLHQLLMHKENMFRRKCYIEAAHGLIPGMEPHNPQTWHRTQKLLRPAAAPLLSAKLEPFREVSVPTAKASTILGDLALVKAAIRGMMGDLVEVLIFMEKISTTVIQITCELHHAGWKYCRLHDIYRAALMVICFRFPC